MKCHSVVTNHLSHQGSPAFLRKQPLLFGLGEGDGTPLQYSCLENPMDGGAWWSTVYEVAESWTRLSN